VCKYLSYVKWSVYWSISNLEHDIHIYNFTVISHKVFHLNWNWIMFHSNVVWQYKVLKNSVWTIMAVIRTQSIYHHLFFTDEGLSIGKIFFIFLFHTFNVRLRWNILLKLILCNQFHSITVMFSKGLIQNYWVFGRLPLFGTLETRKHDVSILRWGGVRHLLSWVP
jgi:hypothetical protein